MFQLPRLLFILLDLGNESSVLHHCDQFKIKACDVRLVSGDLAAQETGMQEDGRPADQRHTPSRACNHQEPKHLNILIEDYSLEIFYVHLWEATFSNYAYE